MCSVIRSLRQAMNACFECLRSTRNTGYDGYDLRSIRCSCVRFSSFQRQAMLWEQLRMAQSRDTMKRLKSRIVGEDAERVIVYIYDIIYAIIALPAVSPFPRFLLTSTAHMPMADRCTVMAFADPWNSFHLATKCDEDLAGKRHRSRVTVRSVSHCKSLWVTGHEANPAWNWVGLGPQPEGRKISIKLAHDKSQTKTPHTSPYIPILYTVYRLMGCF